MQTKQASEERAEFERAQPTEAQVIEIVKRGIALGQPQYKQDGTMTFVYFLDTMKIVIEFIILNTREGMERHNVERRAAIAAGNEELYYKLILKITKWE